MAKESQRRLKITEIYTRHSVVEAIEDNKDPTQFVPTKRYISILFSDIRNFTHISESMNPMEIVALLNGYFDEMNEHIARRGGEIDKWIGDIVNSAGRIEGLTKYYGLPLLISGEFKDVLKDSYRTRFVDQVMVKGRKHAMRIFEVLDHEDEVTIRDRLPAAESYGGAYALYSKGDFLAAMNAFSDLAPKERAGEKTPDPFLKFYRNRCEMLAARKEAGGLTAWDGTFEFLEK